MRIERPPPRRWRLGLTPMIDVVFLLLVFFMLVSTFVEPGSIALEQDTAPVTPMGNSAAIRVHIHGTGAITVDDELVPLATLANAVRSLLTSHGGLAVRVRSDPAVPLQRLVEVVDHLRLAGATDLILASQ
jgi:biopolymer transport protein ExbD